MADGLVFIGCEYTGNMARPWAEAGYECICVDIRQEKKEERVGAGVIRYVEADLIEYLPPRSQYAFAAFHPECTNLAVSGARWFKKKGLAGLADAIRLVERCAALGDWMGCKWMLENPVGTLSTYWRKPDYIFHPWMYGDNEQKATCIWSGGGFVMPESVVKSCPADVKQSVWKMPPCDDRGRKRSVISPAFSEAVFRSNCITNTVTVE